MRTFIFSYIASITSLIFVNYPAIISAPLELLPRICVYFGLPLAVALSMVVILVGHALRTMDKTMRTFVFSYIASVASLIFINYPTTTSAPLELLPRICVYFGLPLAVALSMVVILVGHALGTLKLEMTANSGIIAADESTTLNPAFKAA